MTHGVVDLDGWRSSLATCGGLVCVASARGVGYELGSGQTVQYPLRGRPPGWRKRRVVAKGGVIFDI